MPVSRLLHLASLLLSLSISAGARAADKQGRSPVDELPPHICRVTHFGERANWSHDGKRILFLAKTFGDVYEVELATGVNGMIARLNDEMTELAEKPRHLKPSNHTQVGFEGAFLTKINKRYYLVCAEFIKGNYHCMIAQADNIYGPYGPRYLAVPHGGHNMLFKDKEGLWWATFFGNDAHAPFRERPGLLRIELDAVRPKG